MRNRSTMPKGKPKPWGQRTTLKSRGQNKTPPQSQSDQTKRFIEAAREAECSEDEAVFDETLRRIAKVKPEAKPPKKPAE